MLGNRTKLYHAQESNCLSRKFEKVRWWTERSANDENQAMPKRLAPMFSKADRSGPPFATFLVLAMLSTEYLCM